MACACSILQKVGFIRIDGRTPSEERQALCDQFQHNAQTLVALLSITAANAGPASDRCDVMTPSVAEWSPLPPLILCRDHAVSCFHCGVC